MTVVARLPTRPRPKLVSDDPPEKVVVEFVAITPAMRAAAGDVKALAARINRAFDGPTNFMSAGARDMAEFQADELADAAAAVAKAIRLGRVQ